MRGSAFCGTPCYIGFFGLRGWRSQQNEHLAENQSATLAHLPKGSNWAEYAFPGIGSPDKPIVQRDDGMFALGWHDDAAGPFASREFAAAVAAKGEGRHALATS
jgi:hypothetical protein